MSVPESQILAARLLDLQRTVERLGHHVNHLQSELCKAQGQRPAKPWGSSIWQRLSGRETLYGGRPVRENRRKSSHALAAH